MKSLKHFFYHNKFIHFALIAIAIRILYFLFSLAVQHYAHSEKIVDEQFSFLKIAQRNDANWYELIALKGYPIVECEEDLGYTDGRYFKQSSWAFFPLYPFSIYALQSILNIPFAQSAFIISMVFSVLSFYLFYLLCLHIFQLDANRSYRYTLYFIVFPFHYYFFMYYTEALFFTFLGTAFLCIHFKKYTALALFLIPLVLIRPNGVFCLIPLYLYYIELNGGLGLFFDNLFSWNFRPYLPSLYFSTAPIALLIYCIYQYNMTGYFFAFSKAQAGWGKEFMIPFLALFRSGIWVNQFNSFYTLGVMILSWLMYKRLPLSLNVLVWINLLLPLSSGSVTSMPRYISVIFPIALFIFEKLELLFSPKLLFVILTVLQLWAFYFWLTNQTFSY